MVAYHRKGARRILIMLMSNNVMSMGGLVLSILILILIIIFTILITYTKIKKPGESTLKVLKSTSHHR